MLRKAQNRCTPSPSLGKRCAMFWLAQLIKENTGANFVLLIPSGKCPTVEMFALLLLEKSVMYLMFRLVWMELSIGREWIT